MHSEAVPKKAHLCCSSDNPQKHRRVIGWSSTTSGDVCQQDRGRSSSWDRWWSEPFWWVRQGWHSLLETQARWVSLPFCDPSSEHGEREGSALYLLFYRASRMQKHLSLLWSVPPAAHQQYCPGTTLCIFQCGSPSPSPAPQLALDLIS